MNNNSNHVQSIIDKGIAGAKESGLVCPKCGGHDGYFHKAVYAHTQFIDFKNEPFNCDIEFVRGGTKKYCATCEKDITEFVKALTKT